MSDPPPPSTQQVQEPPFFHHPDGQRIQVFVEAGGILNRPRLIRNLKKHDANICSDPKHAQVILVDADSWQGKEFIREWGKDQNKVVLSYTWVAICVGAGKPLLADQGWGGCLTHDDGLPILRPTANGDDKEVQIKAPFPTPRGTPIETGLTSPKRPATSEMLSKRLSLDRNLLQVTTAPGNEGASSSMPHLPSHIQQQQQQPQPQSPSIHSPSNTDAISIFAQQQQNPSNMSLGMPNSVMPPFSMGVNMMPFPQNMLAMFAQQQQQQAAASSSITSQPPAVMPQMQENFTTALMDIMKMYGAIPGGMPMGQWPMFPGMMPQQIPQIPPLSAGGSSGSGTVVREGSSVASASRRDTESPRLSAPLPGRHSPSVLHSSIKRKRKSDVVEYDSAEEKTDTEDDEDGDEPPLASLTKKKKKTERKQKQKEKEERTAKRTSLPYAAPARNPHENQSQASRLSTGATSAGRLFVNADEKPMQFFVQVDLKDRLEVTRAIKKNGGLITSEITTADYAVLWSRSTTFKELLSNANASQTPAVTFHFVLDAINHGSIPENLENYLFDTKQKLKRKKTSKNPVDAETKRLGKNARAAERRAKERAMAYNYIARSEVQENPTPPVSSSASSTVLKGTSATPKPTPVKNLDQTSRKAEEPKRPSTPIPKVKKPRAVSASTSASASTSSSVNTKVKKKPAYYPRDKSPTPPTQAEKLMQGYAYTSDERDWTEKYLFVLFKRDPNMSQTAVSKALHLKLPHHTPGSWATFLTGGFRLQYDEARKRGGIAHRKEKGQWEHEQQRKQQEQDQDQDHVNERKRDKGKEQDEEQGTDHMMDDVMEVEKELQVEEVDKERASPDHAPMDIDGPTQTAPEPGDTPQEGQNGLQLTQAEEEDMEVFIRFFVNGGDDPELSEEQILAKLEQVAQCKSAPTWEEFNIRHEQEIVIRYGKRMDEEVVKNAKKHGEHRS